jgi:hypothetical protein
MGANPDVVAENVRAQVQNVNRKKNSIERSSNFRRT